MNLLYRICLCLWVVFISFIVWIRIVAEGNPMTVLKWETNNWNYPWVHALGVLTLAVFLTTIASLFCFIFSL
jgi:hypothetical protein